MELRGFPHLVSQVQVAPWQRAWQQALTTLPRRAQQRGLLYVTRKGCHFRSKRGNLLKRFEELCYGVREELPVKEAILDGEVVALDTEGRQNFRDLTAGRGNLHYAAFDALWIEGKDLRPLLLTRRKHLLTRLIPATTTVLSQTFSIEERGRDLFAAAERLDLEGIVTKSCVRRCRTGPSLSTCETLRRAQSCRHRHEGRCTYWMTACALTSCSTCPLIPC
jgi:ATP dependent DNA ligase-like protein